MKHYIIQVDRPKEKSKFDKARRYIHEKLRAPPEHTDKLSVQFPTHRYFLVV